LSNVPPPPSHHCRNLIIASASFFHRLTAASLLFIAAAVEQICHYQTVSPKATVKCSHPAPSLNAIFIATIQQLTSLIKRGDLRGIRRGLSSGNSYYK
jgi:hypothetical protein